MRISVIGWAVAVTGLAIAITGCTSGAERRPPTPSISASPPGCGGTEVRHGNLPGWTRDAGAPSDLPYVVSAEGNLVGTLFGAPLRAPAPGVGRQNKILWIVREARGGQPLALSLHRVDGPAADVTTSEEADSGPGEIYPSIVDVPVAGCWHVTARWNGNTANLDLRYESA